MSEVENLSILIDVFDDFSDELLRLILLLENVQAVAEMVDDITIDVDVRGEHELATLIGELSALEAMDLSGLGDIVVGDKRVTRRTGGGGGGISARQLSRLSDEITDALENMTVAARSTTEGMDTVTDSAEGAGDAMDAASDSAGVFDLRMTDLHNALAKLVPLIFVIIGALPAIIGGLIALGAAAISAAAALAAIGGIGALGFALARGGRDDLMGGLQEAGEEAIDDFLDAFLPLAQRLTPVFEDALDGIDRLFQRIANRGDVLVKFSDDARAFGEFMMDFIPEALEAMGRMASAFGGIFALIADGMRDAQILEGLTSFMAQAADELILFTQLLVSFLPVIAKLSIGFLEVLNAIGVLVQGFAQLLSLLPVGSEAIGAFIATLLAAITVSLLLSKALGVNVVAGLAAMFEGFITVTGGLITAYIPGVSAATATTIAFALAIGLATAGLSILLGGVTALGSKFVGLSTDIGKATESLKAFDSAASGVSGPNAYKHPNLQRGDVQGSSRFSDRSSRGGVQVNIEGHADPEQTREQVENANYRLERPSRQL